MNAKRYISGILSKTLLISIFLIFVSCASDIDENVSILPENIVIKPGDLCLRCGGSFDSHAVLIADHGSDYSHIGIAVESDSGNIMVVHAVPDEPEFEGDVDRVKMETPQKFFIRKNAIYGQIRRFEDENKALRASKIAKRVYDRGTLFDSAFDLNDTTRMYCTELILYSFDRAGAPLNIKATHKAQWMDYNTIMPSDIIATKRFNVIANF